MRSSVKFALFSAVDLPEHAVSVWFFFVVVVVVVTVDTVWVF